MPLSSFIRATAFCAFICSGLLQAQHLTISTSGDMGPINGNNWSISSNTLTVGSSGSANIHPSVITNYLTNTGSLTVILPAQAGVVRDIYINNTIAYTGSTARTLTINAANDLIVSNGVSITSSNAAMNLVLRSIFSAGTPDHGRIQLNATTINTNGGHFWAGGGSGNTTWNGLTVGNGYAKTWADNVAGISFLSASLTTSGGSIYMAGQSFNTSDAFGENYGINIRNSSIASGSGQIDILGDLKGMYTTGSGLGIFGNDGPVSISSTTGAINLSGTGADQTGTNSGWRRGVLLYTLSTTPVSVTSNSGNITITGTAAFPATTGDDIIGLQLGTTTSIADGIKITSRTGNIVLEGSNTREAAGQNSNAVQFIAANVANSIRIGHDGTNAYSGNITIEGNSIIQNNVNAGSGSISVRSTGTLTIQPSGGAFTFLRAGAGTLTFDDDWNFGTTLSGFTFGKSTNTLDLTYDRPLTVAGPITFHTGNFTCNDNITASTASSITINARGDFNTDNLSRQTISSNNGNISIIADSDGNGTGVLDLDRLTINPGSGNILIRGETFNWGTGTAFEIPIINGTGSLTIEPSDISFGQGLGLTQWFRLNDDNSQFSGITLGKPTNTQSIEFGINSNGVATGSVSVNGPVTVYGGVISINQNINTTSGAAGGTVLLKSRGDISLEPNRVITTSGASVTLWANSDNEASNGSISLRNGSSIVTGSNTVAGGHVWLGGGGDGITWNGLAVGSGYAVPGTTFTPSNGGGTLNSGIYLERNSITSFGGNIKIAGDGAASARGIVSYGNTININSGSGKIEMDGQVTSAAAGDRMGILFGLHDNIIASTVNLSSSSTSGDAITITGIGRGTADAIALSGTLNITSSGGGNIVMNGNALGTGRSIVAGNFYHGILNVFANAGNITLNGNTKAVQVATEVIGGLTSGPSKINIGQGGSISSSSSNVVLTADNIALAAGGIAVNTSGTVTIEPSSNSFANPLTFPITNLSIANTITGLTLGKSTNTANITVSAAQTIAGPIRLFGGNLTLNGACSTSVATGHINLLASGDIIQSAAITTQGGSLVAWADRDGTGGGRIHFNANITTNGGHIYAGGGTASETPASTTLTVPTGYASSTNALFSGLIVNGNTINSGGGTIRMKGSSGGVDGDNAGVMVYNTSISSGAGALTLDGKRVGDPFRSGGLFIGTEISSAISTGNVTISSTSGNINLEGTTESITNTHSWACGLAIVSYGGDDITISSTTGSITMFGDATNASAYTGQAVGFVIQSDNVAGLTRINTDGGAISITGSSGNTGDDFGSSYRGANTAGNITIGDANTGNITLRFGSLSGNSNVGSVTLQSAGNYVLEGIAGAAFATAIDVNTSYSFGSSGTGLRIGSTNNNQNITIQPATSIAGPITIYGGNIFAQQSLTSTASGAAILLQSTGYIDLAANRTLQTNNGNITLRANSTGTAVVLPDATRGAITLNSGSSLLSNGGNITLGGNFAGTKGAGLYAASARVNGAPGILISNATLSAAGGNINIYGRCSTSYDDGIRLEANITTTGSGSIGIYGDAHGGLAATTPNTFFGGITFNTASSTIETENGTINVEGMLTNTQSNGTCALNFYRTSYSSGTQNRHIQLISKTGNIQITGNPGSTAAGGVGSSSWGNIYVGSPLSNLWTATGNVTFTFSDFAGAISYGNIVKTTGAVTYEPVSTSFTAAQTFPENANHTLAASASSLTIGKPGNTASIDLTAAISVAGPIAVYGGNISVADDIASTSVPGGNITLSASNGFTTAGSTAIQRDITTSGGNILIEADANADATGTLDLDYLVLNAGSGNTIIRGETVSFSTASESIKPWINGTGTFTLESNDASFTPDFYMSWFRLNQDGNSLTGFNFGKTTNATSLFFNSVGALTINGPVNVNGAAISFSTSLTVTNNNLSLRATGAVTQSASITSAGLALNGTGTFTLTNTSNNFTTLAGGAVGTLIGATEIIDASGGLTIGTVGSNTGLLGSGTIRVETLAGNLTLAGSISTTSTSTNAIILTAAKNTAIGVPTGGDILVSGSPTITMGSGAIAKLFSGYDVTSTGLTTLVGGASNARYNCDETTTTFNPTLSINNAYAIYRTGLGYGNLNIVSTGGDAEGTTWTYSGGVITTTSGTVNILNTDIQSKLSLANLNIEADRIIFSANITSNNANALRFLSKTHIANTNATTITTQGGNVLFASNVDDAADGESTTNGYIQLRNGITINTNGGNITFGGGNTSGSDYALGSSAENYTEGVRFDALVALNSAGGDITIRGKSYARSVQLGYGASGVGFYFFTGPAGTINSGSGKITIDGFSQTNTSDYASGIYCMHNITITSANTTADAIRLIGKATGASGHAWGIETDGTFSVLATAAGGGITISSSQQIANDYDAVFRGETNILAVSGPIQMLGRQDGGVANGRWFIGNNFFLGSKASSAVTSSSSNITIQYDLYNFSTLTPRLATSGTIDWRPASASFGQDVYTTWFLWNQNSQTPSGLTIGKIGNAANVFFHSAITVAGPINVYGNYVEVGGAGSITSSGTGDIFLKGIANSNGSVNIGAVSITKIGGTGTLTLQANGRAINSGTIAATGTGVLNVVIWSDFDGDNVGGGSSLSAGSISTNGGHVWVGGSNSNGGSYTWNGLTVGDGPSTGASGSNCNALDLFSPITTNGGDVLLWAGNNGGCGTNGIASDAARHINAGSGDITLIALQTGGTIQLTSTGTLTLVPNGGSYASALTCGGTTTSGNFTFNTSHYSGVVINSITNVGGLTIGRFAGMLSSGTPVVMGNTSNVTISAAISITGPLEIYGGAIAMNANLTTTGTSTGNITISGITLSGTGNMAVANGRTATINVSDASTYAGIISGTGSGLTKLGTGVLTLTNDHTYTGATTISGGDLQVGTGGSVSQASSGSLATASAVSVASGSKLILAPNDNMTFANSVSGAGGLEIKGMSGAYYNSFLTSTATTMVSNATVLEVLTRITGGLQAGLHIPYNGNQTQTAGAYIKSYNAASNTATLQFQQYDGLYTKCVFAELSQSGTNVQIRGNTSIYNGAAYRSGNSLGSDMSTGSTSIGALATSSSANGYGISNVYMSGKVNFTGSLTYSGTTTLSNTVTSVTSPNTYSYTSRGTQEITDASTSFPSGSSIVNNGLVIFNRTTALTVSNDMSGAEEVLQVGADITMTGANTYTGNTTIDLNKTLNIGSGGTSGSMTGNIINYGSLTFNRSDSSVYGGVISGTGTVTKNGSGATTFTGLNNYTGATTINAGRLILQRDVPSNSSSSYSGAGMLVIQPNSNSFTNAVTYPISGFNVSSSIGGLTIGKVTNTSAITVSSATQAAGPINMYGGNITVNENLSTTNNGSIMLDAETGSQLTFNGNGISLATSKSISAHGTGTVTILGRGGNTVALLQCGVQLGAGTSVTTGGGNITIDGRGGNSGGDSHYGVQFAQGTNINIASNGGNITISGQGDGSGNNNDGINFQNTTILAGSGSITLDGKSKDDGLNSESLAFGASNMAFGGATQTGNIIFRGDHVWSGGPATKTAQSSGTLTFEPSGNSFSSTQTYPFDVFTISSITGLNLGKSTNTAGITIGSATAVAGPVSVYGGTLTFNENLSSTVGGNISLYGNTLAFASGKTVSSTGELLVAPQSAGSSIGLANGTGTLQVTATHLSTNFANGFSNITIGSDAQTGNISSNAFTLQDNMTFKTTGTLSLGGNITLGTNNATLGNSLSMGTGNNYFQTNSTGVLKRSVGNAGTFAFPVGNSAYNPASITNNTGAADEFSLRVLDEVYKNGNSGPVVTGPRVRRTWLIDKTAANAGSGINFVFNWNSGESTANLNSPRLYHYDGTEWDKQT
ncbi:MAG: autotransporter-associated beta strand repeat-containing protein, partial [Sphingomonadales bacterium]